jgi:hypothetical protein
MQTRDLDRIRFVTRHFHDLQGLRYWVPLGLLTLSVGGTTYFLNWPWVILRAGLFLGAFLLALGARRYYWHTFGEVERPPVRPIGELSSISIYSPAGPASRLAGSRGIPSTVQRFMFGIGLALMFFLVLQAISPPVMINTDESLVQQPWHTLGSVLFFELSGAPDLVWGSGSTLKAAFGQMMYALYGAFFLGVWLWRERRLSQSYHLVLGVLLLGLSALGICLGFLGRANGEIAEILNLFVPAVVHLWVALLLCGSSMILAGLLDHWQLVRALGRRVED